MRLLRDSRRPVLSEVKHYIISFAQLEDGELFNGQYWAGRFFKVRANRSPILMVPALPSGLGLVQDPTSREIRRLAFRSF